MTNVGLLVSEPATNMPDNATLQQLAEVCCAHGASLFLVLAQAKVRGRVGLGLALTLTLT